MKPQLSRAILIALAVAWIAACDSPTESTSIDVTLSSSPDPAVAEASSGVSYTIEGDDNHPDEVIEYPWRTSFVLMAHEEEGMALDVTAVTLRVQQASGGIVIAPSGGDTEHYQFNSSAGGNHLNANGSLSIGFEVWYDLPNEGREALVTVTVTFRDEDNRTYSGSLEVKVS
jgi:hypothetical protein